MRKHQGGRAKKMPSEKRSDGICLGVGLQHGFHRINHIVHGKAECFEE